jgi:hypothetical protein
MLVVVDISEFVTARIEGIRSFEARNCSVRMVRSYSDFGLFEFTHDYSIRFGGLEPMPGKSVSEFSHDLPPRYQLMVEPERTLMNNLTVTFTGTAAIVQLPGRPHAKDTTIPVVVVHVPFTLCGTLRGGMGDG